MSRPTPRARAAAFALGATGLTGCEWPDVSMSPGLGAAAETTEAAEPTDEPADETPAEETATTDEVAVPTPVRPTGDLDAGSLTRALPAGDRTVVVDYWTADQATTWTAAQDKTIQIAAHVEGGDDETEVLVTRFAATTDDGTARLLAAEDRGEFALMPPFSYTTALTLTEATPAATSLTVTVQFDLLVETEPGAQRYFRQTVLDTLELPLLQEDPS
ncbi:hypothetical protein [Geodermatophilus sp. FMUSA9-8]|uniref:hypothetical protein n=1 Tax=Geodermatophilus sp. FMUSA9-8 TaxID=3120155 RepID=UPI00300802C1